MTKAEIAAAANDRRYSEITINMTKAEMITAFLEAQDAQ